MWNDHVCGTQKILVLHNQQLTKILSIMRLEEFELHNVKKHNIKIILNFFLAKSYNYIFSLNN